LRKAFPLNSKSAEVKENVEEEEMEEDSDKEIEKEFDEVAKKGKKKKKKKGLAVNVVNLDSFAESVPEDELAGIYFLRIRKI
jgi:hypothetical protein